MICAFEICLTRNNLTVTVLNSFLSRASDLLEIIKNKNIEMKIVIPFLSDDLFPQMF